MSKKQIIGLVIFLVLILIIVGIKFMGDKKDSVSGKDLTTVYVATGGGHRSSPFSRGHPHIRR